ncbi:MAG: glycosyltransferase family 4 protein [Planctomycetes bacterium]|nr:glycosyltransferase family 4 protein [Planctomycetota bacterium]
MRMVLLCRGWNSGINESLALAWRQGCPDMTVDVCDVERLTRGGLLRRGLRRVLERGRDALCRPAHHALLARRLADSGCLEGADFALAFGTLIPVVEGGPPQFIYTDHTIQANLYYPRGLEHMRRWQAVMDLERDSIQRSPMVFTMGRHVARSLLEHYGLSSRRVRCVGAGCNAPPPAAPVPGRYASGRIVFVGFDWQRKGGPALLEAFARLRGRHPQATLTIVGARPRVHGWGGAVRVVGPVPLEQVGRHLAESAVFCMPSYREPFGIAYLDAMHAGLPVVAWRLGAAPDFVLDGRTGYTVEPDDLDGLTDRLDRLLGDPDACRRIGGQGCALVQRVYTWQRAQALMWRAIQDDLGLERHGLPDRESHLWVDPALSPQTAPRGPGKSPVAST